jgi:hypothetical protein
MTATRACANGNVSNKRCLLYRSWLVWNNIYRPFRRTATIVYLLHISFYLHRLYYHFIYNDDQNVEFRCSILDETPSLAI